MVVPDMWHTASLWYVTKLFHRNNA